MNIERIKENTIGSIFKFSIPAIIAMVLSSFVTIVDGFFISRMVNKEALASINLGLPMLFLFLALSLMIGVGGASLAGRRMGQKNVEESIRGFNQTVVTGIIAFVVLGLVIGLLLKPVLSAAGLEGSSVGYILEYYGIMLWVYPLMMINIIFGMFIRAEGKHHIFMMNTIITTLANIVLDYIFIKVFSMGISGAALASAVAVVLGTLLMILYFKSGKSLFMFKKFHFSKRDFKETLGNGSSEFIGQISASITMFVMNIVIFRRLGLTGIAAMTIIGYSHYVFDMIVVGFGQGVSPIISFSYGAEEYSLCGSLRKDTSRIVMGAGIAFFIVLNIFSSTYAQIFTREAELINLIRYGLGIFGVCFIFMGVNVITSFYFTGIGYAKESAIISAMRGLVLLIINIGILPLIFGDSGIWLVAPVTEGITVIVALSLLKKSKISIKEAEINT